MTTATSVALIAVVGGSGAGKGWFVNKLCGLLGDRAAHLQLDDFYRDRSHLPMARRARINFDVPRAIDWDAARRVLLACREGLAVQVPRYDFATHSRRPEGADWTPRPVVFVDGLWLLRPPAVRELFDLKIFLDTPAGLRRERRLARDVAERGYTPEAIEHQLRTAVAPMHTRYVEPQKRHADLVLPQPFRARDLAALADRLWAVLQRAGAVEAWRADEFRTQLFAEMGTHEYRN